MLHEVTGVPRLPVASNTLSLMPVPWVLSMRGMGVTIQGEDYVNFAEHKGLGGSVIFRDYYLRNALLPQVTGLALALGSVITNGIVVEGIFGLPGVGAVLG